MTGSAFVGPDLRSQRAFSSFLPTKEQPDNQQEALDVAQGDTYLVSPSFFPIYIFFFLFSKLKVSRSHNDMRKLNYQWIVFSPASVLCTQDTVPSEL